MRSDWFWDYILFKFNWKTLNFFGSENTRIFFIHIWTYAITSIDFTSWEIREKEVFAVLLPFPSILPEAIAAIALVVVSIFQTWGKKERIVFIPGKKLSDICTWLCLHFMTRPISHDLPLASRKTMTYLYFFFICFKLSTLRFPRKSWILARNKEWILR